MSRSSKRVNHRAPVNSHMPETGRAEVSSESPQAPDDAPHPMTAFFTTCGPEHLERFDGMLNELPEKQRTAPAVYPSGRTGPTILGAGPKPEPAPGPLAKSGKTRPRQRGTTSKARRR